MQTLIQTLMDFIVGLFASHYYSSLHQGVIYLHVAAALLALVVAPGAMLADKTSRRHKRWGRIYFWGMVAANLSAFWLLTWRFNFFLFAITVLSLYGVLTGYRAMHRKQQQVRWFDRGVTGVVLLSGLGMMAWALLTALGLRQTVIPGGSNDNLVQIILPLIFGAIITLQAREDLTLYIKPSPDRRWWWYYHMDRMLGSYIALTSALMVQQVGPRLPGEIAWLAWVAPTVIGTPLISLWISHYRRKFGADKSPVEDPRQPTPSLG